MKKKRHVSEEQLNKQIPAAVEPEVTYSLEDIMREFGGWSKQEEPEDDRPPLPDDADAPPEFPEEPPAPRNETPSHFWPELCGAVRKELKPPAFGFFAATPNAPIQGVVKGNRLELLCANSFVAQTIDKPEILEVVSRKASAMLGKSVTAFSVDTTRQNKANPRLDQLIDFGKNHPDIVKIKK